MIWRLVVLLLYGPAFALAVYLGEFARAAGTLGNLALALALLAMAHGGLVAATQPRRKADPVKIARMEVDLQTGPAWERAKQSRELVGCIDPDCPHEHYRAGGFGNRICIPADEAPTVDIDDAWGRLPPKRDVEDCPRPEACVIAHPCRKCGADRGRKCVGDDLLDEMEF